jgi:hypothetical protein
MPAMLLAENATGSAAKNWMSNICHVEVALRPSPVALRRRTAIRERKRLVAKWLSIYSRRTGRVGSHYVDQDSSEDLISSSPSDHPWVLAWAMEANGNLSDV